VVAPTFPFGGGRAPEGEGGNDLAHQPADMSFVIGELLRLSGDGASPLAGSIDPARVGAAGHSLGGMTTLALAGNTCCHDARVKAAAVLAGREMPFGRGQFWTRIRTPVLFVHGEEDASVPYADGRRAFASAPPPRFLVTIVGGDHGRPFGGASDDAQARVVTDATLDFFDHYLKGDPDALVRLGTDAAVTGVARLESEV
jgi:predicted dienelactone hydrolase